MATWIAHLRIAESLLEHLPDLDPEQFSIGSIAPDSGVSDEFRDTSFPSSEVTHFKRSSSVHKDIADLRFYRDYLALLDPAALLLEQTPDERIVILVDALDELRYHPGKETLLKWLAACPELPSNLRFVLTSRPDPLLDTLRRRQRTWLREATIDLGGVDVQAALRRWVGRFVAQEGVRDALAARGIAADM